MLLYYGADSLVIKPEYGKGNKSNDYGLGFYLTDDKNMAKLWASRFLDGGYLITYDVNIDNFKILHLEDDNENIMQWLTLLVKHRFSKEEYVNSKNTIDWLISHYELDINEYDMIIGYRADDSYFAYSRDFVNNELSLELLSNAMKIGKLGKQYVLKSQKSFNNIKMVSYEKIEKSNSYEQFRKQALNEYHVLKKDDNINNTFIRDLMRKENN